MKKNVLYGLMALVFVTACIGCTASQNILQGENKTIAQIENYQDALKPEFQFLGKVSAPVKAGWASEHSDAQLQSESIVYAQAGSGRVIEKMLIVRTYQIRGESSMSLPELDLGNQILLDSGIFQMDSKKFNFKLLPARDMVAGNERKLISGKRLVISDCYLLKAYSGKLTGYFEKSISYILYFEKLGTGNVDAACGQFIRSQNNKILVNNVTVAADGYVRRLIGASDEGKSVSEKTSDEKVNREALIDGGSDLERKLTTLKGLLDKDLITEDDYKQKKLKLIEGY